MSPSRPDAVAGDPARRTELAAHRLDVAARHRVEHAADLGQRPPAHGVDVGVGHRYGYVQARLQVDSVARARLEDHLQHRLGVEVVELDRLADPAAHQHLGSELLEVRPRLVGLLVRGHHHGDVVQALAVLVEPLLVDARALERLEELEDDRPGVALRAEHRELGRLPVQLGRVQHRRLVLVDVPRAPAERLVVGLQRAPQIPDHGGHLGDGQAAGIELDARHVFRLLSRQRCRCRSGPSPARCR